MTKFPHLSSKSRRPTRGPTSSGTGSRQRPIRSRNPSRKVNMTKFTYLPPEILYMIYHYLLAPSKFKYKAFAEE
jgi:hypothetical protein